MEGSRIVLHSGNFVDRGPSLPQILDAQCKNGIVSLKIFTYRQALAARLTAMCEEQ